MTKEMKQSGNSPGQIWGKYLFIAILTENVPGAWTPWAMWAGPSEQAFSILRSVLNLIIPLG